MKISIVAAIGRNRELGGKNKLLWHIPGELKRFKEITTGHPIIMGRETFESIGRVLPNRLNIIITRDLAYKADGATVVDSLEKAIEESMQYTVSSIKQEKKENILNTDSIPDTVHEVLIIGGGQIFAQALPITDRLYLSVVDGDFPEADVFFPDYSRFKKVVKEEKFPGEPYGYTFFILEK